ncbi:MAG TPA: HTTM domain-containing protein [Polyangiaceae bacterium]|nr:HTTM domain-containing protein [Polyangiaceae bacterium]
MTTAKAEEPRTPSEPRTPAEGTPAGAGGGLLAFVRERYCAADRRVLGLFRIYFGCLLVVDVLRRVPDATFFYSAGGVLPNHREPPYRPYFSLFEALSSTAEVRAGLAVTALVCALYAVGYKTRVMQIAAFVLVTSLNARNYFVENGGVIVVNLVAFWSLFLPLGDRFSVDALLAGLRREPAPTPEALGARARLAPDREPFHSIAMLAVAVQIAAIYFFNALHKTGPAWKAGEAVHYVLWQNRIVTGLAGWLRLHEPGWFSPLTSWAALAIEWLAPALVLAPFAQRYLRTAHVVLACSLHLAIAALMNLGAFSYAMVALNLLVLPREAVDRAASALRGKRSWLVAYDPSDPGARALARLLARLDPSGRLRFAAAGAGDGAGAPEGAAFAVRDDAAGAWAEGRAALARAARALPFGALLGPALAPLLGRLYDRRAALARRLAPAPAPPAGDPDPAPDSADSADSAPPLTAAQLRELFSLAMLLAMIIQLTRDNHSVPKRYKLNLNEPLSSLVLYPRLLQGWGLFSPDAPKDDGTVVVDAVTVDGRHVDPFTGQPPDFEAARHGPWGLSQLYCDYFLRISWGQHARYRDALKNYLLARHELEGLPAHDQIKSFEAWWVTNQSPPPGSTVPTNIKKVPLVSSR